MYLNETKTQIWKKQNPKNMNPHQHFLVYSTFSNSSLEAYKQKYSSVGLKQKSCNDKPPVKKAFY